MRLIGVLIGAAAFAKGLLLFLDPEGFVRLGNRFIGLLPAPAGKTLDRHAGEVLECARQAPGGLRTTGLLLSGSGLLVLVLSLRSR